MDSNHNEKSKMNWYKLSYNEKQEVLSAVEAKVGLPAFVLENDRWVVQTLRLITQMDISDQIVFKGGTSLIWQNDFYELSNSMITGAKISLTEVLNVIIQISNPINHGEYRS